ncbi:uncharacterized protein BP01DRAFT_321624 [Aspergillus saccharolyticus JOP 1030-1]|uniref:Immediate-early protein n=1 Tax=Aspergillus saccharolyticus JOP 1030-1 TaxID=1450539 RepID=A0A318Z9Z2_9EURO|nr:hypothetical protein BP01DRAFT_321624 [Aspergillus saccharolyticus JOP 1030-1]PYH44241.1 hypothetical protein BP01DRAFT_321624 [Aspergillus saccharolyticus JOP 1030-1]
MLSQFVTAAKGLFTRSDNKNPQPTFLEPRLAADKSASAIASIQQVTTPTTTTTTPKMVTATRQRRFTAESSAEPEANGIGSVNEAKINGNGKRTSEPSTDAENNNARKTQSNTKRRKRSSLAAVLESEDEMATSPSNKKSKTVKGTNDTEGQEDEQEETPVAAPQQIKKKHFRFDSEEPEVPAMAEVAETPQSLEEEEDSSDDEAPEAVDNSAQLSKIRMEAKRQERAKQIEEQLKRDKRKQLDDLRKLQAKSTSKKREAEDQLSESTETLQGTTTESARRSALPALLPDDILNAAPDVRPPTPPAEEMRIVRPKPTKLRFLDKKEKAPKDLQMGDVTIRVLDGDVSRNKKSKTTLPPKATKSSQNARQVWLSAGRSTGKVNGMRRAAGAPSGFVRK